MAGVKQLFSDSLLPAAQLWHTHTYMTPHTEINLYVEITSEEANPVSSAVAFLFH